jgi:hypothetical protein
LCSISGCQRPEETGTRLNTGRPKCRSEGWPPEIADWREDAIALERRHRETLSPPHDPSAGFLVIGFADLAPIIWVRMHDWLGTAWHNFFRPPVGTTIRPSAVIWRVFVPQSHIVACGVKVVVEQSIVHCVFHHLLGLYRPADAAPEFIQRNRSLNEDAVNGFVPSLSAASDDVIPIGVGASRHQIDATYKIKTELADPQIDERDVSKEV